MAVRFLQLQRLPFANTCAHPGSAQTCRSCGRICSTGEAFIDHYGDALGCHRKRVFDSEEEEEEKLRRRMRASSPVRGVSVPVTHVNEQEAGMDLDLGDQGRLHVRDVPILHLLPEHGGEFKEEQLACQSRAC